MSEKPKCPNCGRKTVRSSDVNYCKHCDRHYDDDPNEGGDYSDRRPESRMEREERRGRKGR